MDMMCHSWGVWLGSLEGIFYMHGSWLIDWNQTTGAGTKRELTKKRRRSFLEWSFYAMIHAALPAMRNKQLVSSILSMNTTSSSRSVDYSWTRPLISASNQATIEIQPRTIKKRKREKKKEKKRTSHIDIRRRYFGGYVRMNFAFFFF